jgi:signal transduction histidine kinase
MKTPATIATARVDKLLGRTLAAGAVALNLESGFNFYGQLQYLNQPLAWLLISILWATTLSVVYTFWFGSANYLYMKIHALYMPVLILSWPFVLTQEVPQDGAFYPWIWWGVDTGWVAVALAFKWRTALVYYISCITFMQVIFSLPMGGSHEDLTLVTDSIYTSLTNACLSIIALMIRYAAQRSDAANSEAIQAEVLRAQAEGQAREKLRIDGLIHDSVLTALINAAQAKSDEEAKKSSELAATALNKLSEIQRGDSSQSSLYCGELFDSIILAAERIHPDMKIKKNCAVSIPVDSEVASALTEATIQAVHNSVLHAGSKASRELSLKSTSSSLKIVIKDDGVGFRVSQVNRGRLGIKTSIIARMQSVGGSAHVVSSPGQGTTVVLEWNKK